VIRDCARQLRVAGMAGRVYGLDFGAVLAFAAARGVTSPLLTDALPEIEPLVVAHFQPEDPHGDA